MTRPRMVDASLKITRALPNGAATVNSSSIDLGLSSKADFVGLVQLLIVAPALVTGDLADAATCSYIVEHSDDDSSFSSVYGTVLTQTGAGGAGAAAAEKYVALPVDVKRYVRLTATKTGVGDASDKSATMALVS